VIGWEPPGVGGTLGEYLIKIGPTSTFVQVKSPGWENEIAKAEGQTSPRLQRPKYLHGEVVATAPWSRPPAPTAPSSTPSSSRRPPPPEHSGLDPGRDPRGQAAGHRRALVEHRRRAGPVLEHDFAIEVVQEARPG